MRHPTKPRLRTPRSRGPGPYLAGDRGSKPGWSKWDERSNDQGVTGMSTNHLSKLSMMTFCVPTGTLSNVMRLAVMNRLEPNPALAITFAGILISPALSGALHDTAGGAERWALNDTLTTDAEAGVHDRTRGFDTEMLRGGRGRRSVSW